MTYPKLVSWHYFNGDSLFTKAPQREVLTKIYAKNEKAEEILKDKQVACLTGNIGATDPYFYKVSEEGFTRRAKNFGKLVRPYEENYPELKNNVSSIKHNLKIYGDYVFIRMAFLDNLRNPFKADNFFETYNFIKLENFTVPNILKLLDFHPQAMFGGEITDYQNKEIPMFLHELKVEFPEIYQQLVECSNKVKEFNDSITYIDKTAYLSTLSPGQVELRLGFIDQQLFYWDGNVLSNKITAYDKSQIEQIIKPSADTTVTIKDDSTVNSNTKFV